jgi:hypothetical protein
MQVATPHREFTTTKFNHLNTKSAIREQQILEPDDDLRSAITFDELLIRVKEDLREMFRNGKK